ncbi:hypothetical protein A0H81_02818 [Grifola frondosa]|uniref:Uncharacterized protein n=1 Tax=Grifola frondosa TaxID=5627 RepID=A0A1C7MLW7_GRIFR|nr:hypothetical protein A0H81_02818 [Grifola frondosa]
MFPGNMLPIAPAQDVLLSAIEQTPSTFSMETNQSYGHEQVLAYDEVMPLLDMFAPSTPEVQNPIEASILMHHLKLGWASFFMPKSLVVKTIEVDNMDKQEHGMEVMNVDDVDDSLTAVEILVRLEVTAQIPMMPKSPTMLKSTGTPLKQRELRNSNHPMLLLMDLKFIKHEMAKAICLPSPMPSKEDHAAEKSKGKEIDCEEKFIYFGKELPKASDVITDAEWQ